jgi:hypothetical protein
MIFDECHSVKRNSPEAIILRDAVKRDLDPEERPRILG